MEEKVKEYLVEEGIPFSDFVAFMKDSKIGRSNKKLTGISL